MRPKEPQHLFVYGTLMRRGASPYAKLLMARAIFAGEAWAPGKLYHLGHFPGAVFGLHRTAKVHGEVFRLKGTAILNALDAYEGCRPENPEPRLFQRDIIDVSLPGGTSFAAWAYSFTGNVSGRPRIASGRFLPR